MLIKQETFPQIIGSIKIRYIKYFIVNLVKISIE